MPTNSRPASRPWSAAAELDAERGEPAPSPRRRRRRRELLGGERRERDPAGAAVGVADRHLELLADRVVVGIRVALADAAHDPGRDLDLQPRLLRDDDPFDGLARAQDV